jgi:stress-induced morphogen
VRGTDDSEKVEGERVRKEKGTEQRVREMESEIFRGQGLVASHQMVSNSGHRTDKQ